jgi:hypothetical protein
MCSRDSASAIRILSASSPPDGRRSGNFLAECGSGVSDADVEAIAGSAVSLLFVCRRIGPVSQFVEEVCRMHGFDQASYSVLRGDRFWKIAVTFVIGSDRFPPFERLRSPNPRVVLAMASERARALVSLYDRPKKGGDFGEPNRAVERALSQAGMPSPVGTTRSLRVVFELMALASHFEDSKKH